MSKPVLAALAATAILCSDAFAYEFVIHNNLNTNLAAFRVTDGEVSGFKRVGPGKRITVEVTLPAGQCIARVRIRTQSGKTKDGKADICNDEGLVVTSGETGVSLKPLNMMMFAN